MSRVLDRLEGKKSHAGISYAKCPAHDDTSPSLTVSEGSDGRVLLHCHAGCTVDQIVSSIGLEIQDLYVRSPDAALSRSQLGDPEAVYPYTDEHGNLLAEFLRYPRKKFYWRKPGPNGEWQWTIELATVPLYKLPAVLSAVSRGDTVFIVEGEKDVDALTALGCVATTNPGGAGKWRDSHSGALRGARVVIIPDNDNAGRNHARQVGESLTGVAAEVRVLYLPGLSEEGGDASDWIFSGGDMTTLNERVAAAALFDDTAQSLAAERNWTTEIPPRRRLTLFSELTDLPVPDWIVSGFIPEQSLVLLYGPSRSGKSFIMVDVACSVARNTSWHGCKVQRGHVVLVAAEGSAHLPRRIEAWHDHHGTFNDDAAISLISSAVRLLDEADVDLLVRQIAELPTPPRLIFFDTLSLCLAPDGDENSTKDMTRAISLVRKLIERTGATVVLVHHSGKKGPGERGSSVLRASSDAVIRVDRDGSQVTLTEEKMRDAAEHDALNLSLVPASNSAVIADSGTFQSGTASLHMTPTELRVAEALSDATPRSYSDLEAAGFAGSSLSRALKTLAERKIIDKVMTTGRPQYRLHVEGKKTDTDAASPAALDPNAPPATSGEVPPSTTTLKGGTVGPPGGDVQTEPTFLPPRTTQATKEVAQEASEIGAAA